MSLPPLHHSASAGPQTSDTSTQGDRTPIDPAGTSRRRLLAGAGAATLAGLAGSVLGAGSAVAAPVESVDPQDSDRSEAGPWPRLHFVRTASADFTVDGHRWRFGGTNCYYLHAQSHYMIDSVLNDASAMSMKVVRAWAFNDGAGDQALQPAPFTYDESHFDSLDYAVYKAGQLGIRLVLPLVNNWPDYGGMQQYVSWFTGLPDDSYGAAVNHDKFYTDARIRRCYLAYAGHVINRRNRYTGLRYRDDPTVMTWELANEPRNRSDKSGRELLRWADDMSRAVKRMAPHQLVAVGDEGFGLDPSSTDYPYGTFEGNRWVALNSLPAVDYATVHLYPQGWGENVTKNVDPIQWGAKWITDHIALAGRTFKKPVVLEEFGLKVEAATGIPDVATVDRGYLTWLTALERAGGAGWQFWILTALTDAGIPYGDYDGFRVLYPSSTASLLTGHAKALAATNG